MNMHEQIITELHRAIDEHGAVDIISPTTVATTVLDRYAAAPVEPHIKYASLEHLKQLARRVLSGRYDAESDESEAHTGEMFSGHLQRRYPTPRKAGGPPAYKLREALTADERRWNVETLRRSGRARLAHADALEAEGESLPVAA